MAARVMHHARWWAFFGYVILPAVSATQETDNASTLRFYRGREPVEDRASSTIADRKAVVLGGGHAHETVTEHQGEHVWR